MCSTNGDSLKKCVDGCQAQATGESVARAISVYGSCPLVFEFKCTFPSSDVPCTVHRKYVAGSGKGRYRGELCRGCPWSCYELVGSELNTSLVNYVSSSAVKAKSSREVGVDAGSDDSMQDSWSRKQKRGYHRVLSCLQYWQSNGFQALWVMLSTASGGDSRLLAEHHSSLIKRVERRGFPGIQHFQVRTSEGNGVLHVIWAWKAEAGFREKSFYVGQRWLSGAWREIHGAPVVWISRIGARRRDAMQVARYCIAQYVSGQSGYEYMSYSWKRAFGFPLVRCWRKFKELIGSFDELVAEWSRFLAGKVVWCDYGGFTLGAIRLGYSTYGSEFWSMLHWS